MLRLVKKDAYQRAISMTPDELARDTELIKELKSNDPFDEDSHYVIIMDYHVSQGFNYASQYRHNILPFHEALMNECIFSITHICDKLKPRIPLAVADWWTDHYAIERIRSKSRAKNT